MCLAVFACICPVRRHPFLCFAFTHTMRTTIAKQNAGNALRSFILLLTIATTTATMMMHRAYHTLFACDRIFNKKRNYCNKRRIFFPFIIYISLLATAKNKLLLVCSPRAVCCASFFLFIFRCCCFCEWCFALLHCAAYGRHSRPLTSHRTELRSNQTKKNVEEMTTTTTMCGE